MHEKCHLFFATLHSTRSLRQNLLSTHVLSLLLLLVVLRVVGVLTRWSRSQLVNAACFLVPDVDARGNTVTHGFILVPATGPYVQQGGVRGHCISCTEGACSRGYRQGERGREAPKSLLEERLIEASANIGCSVVLCCVLSSGLIARCQ